MLRMAFLGGAAKRGSQILREEREEALSTIDDEIKILTQLGLPKATARRQKRVDKSAIYDKLDDYFDSNQIAVIMKEGSGQKVLDHIENMRGKYENYKVRPGEIVTLHGNQEVPDYTKDEVLDLIMGELGKGTPVLEAMEKVTGRKDGTLTSALGGNLRSARETRMAAIARATGSSMDELAALAADDIIYQDSRVKGTVTLFDPAAAASAAKDTFTANQMDIKLNAFAGPLIKSSKQAGRGGMFDEDVLYSYDDNMISSAITNEIRNITIRQREIKTEKGDYGPFTTQDLRDMEAMLSASIPNLKTADGRSVAVNPAPPLGDGTIGGPLQLEGLNISQLESTLKDELKEVQGKRPDRATAMAMADQVRKVMKEKARKEGLKITDQSIDGVINNILFANGYRQDDDSGSGITLKN